MNLKRALETVKSYNFRTLNFRLIIYVIVLSIIGINVVSSAAEDSSTVYKQIIGLGIGLVMMVVFALVKYEFIARYYWLLYLFSILILGIVLSPLGSTYMGAQRWIDLKVVSIQPSEFAKILVIIFFAALIGKNQTSLNSWKFVFFMIVLAAIPLFLIFKEPDLSTSIVLFVTICAIILTSNLHKKFIRIIALCAIPLIAGVLVLIIVLPADKNILSEYQYNRIIGFYDEENEVAATIRYQQENSVLAIANGGLTGKGLKNNSITSVKNADFISEPETDFIFTIVGEELGFVGSMAVVLLLFLIVFECVRTGMRARESIGKGIAIGFGSLIAVQTLINLGVVTMILPNTGLTLPFVSAGLSSLIVLYIGVGIILNIGLRKKISF